ncbi:MAG: single-stranded DNA-binding protein [Christensenellales bacterium]|jgi:single-strand DNA-binding protein
MNKCFLIGNLTRDPELKTTASGISVCNFTLAITRRFSNQQGEREADFLPVVVWRTQAENCAKYLRKGSQVAVSGSIQTRSYDAQDGTRRYVTEIVGEEVKFLNRIAGREDSGDGYQQDIPRESYSQRSKPPVRSAPPQTDEIDEDLPF